ncbi:MAG: serpin family protein [Granulosicoccus sp.]
MTHTQRTLTAAMLAASLLTACSSDDDPVTNALTSETDSIPSIGTEARSNLDRINPEVPPADADTLANDNLRFAFNLYQQAKLAGSDNIFFSPHSISIAMAMTYAGARTSTAEQIATAMQFSLSAEQLPPAFNALDQNLKSNVSDDFQLNIVNQMWGREGEQWQTEYLDTLAQQYGAGLQEMDFTDQPEQSRVQINDWVADVTQDRILDLLPAGSISAATALVLTNAIYFKALWRSEFDAGLTHDMDFNLADGSTVSVPMMHATESYDYFDGGNYEAIRLPYKQAGLSMIALVPPTGQFDAFEQSLDATVFSDAVAGLQSKMVSLGVPKIEYEAPLPLKSHLIELGMPLAFADADFSGIRADGGLFIDDVLHKAFIKVDEKGTEAAAATAVVFAETAAPQADVTLNLDRPYVFAIHDESTNAVLFLGRVVNPSS